MVILDVRTSCLIACLFAMAEEVIFAAFNLIDGLPAYATEPTERMVTAASMPAIIFFKANTPFKIFFITWYAIILA